MAMVTLILAFRLSTLLVLLAGVRVADAADAPGTEAAALLRLKASFTDPTNALEAWSLSSPSSPCNASKPWPGVQCYEGVLIGLRLVHLNLSGAFDFGALAHLPGLHSVNLKRNAFSGPLPASIATLRGLRALYLSNNAFTGPVPGYVFTSMQWLKKLYLDHNDLSGALPAEAIAGAPRLLELHLDHNKIEGHVPEFLPASLRLFNVSHNRLTGVLPLAVATRFNETAFAGNPGLCGAPGSDAGACAAAAPVHTSMPPISPRDYFAVEEETSVFIVIGIILLVIALVTGAMILMLRQDEWNSPPYYDHAPGSPSSPGMRGKAAVAAAAAAPHASAAAAAAVAVGGGSSHGSSSQGSSRGGGGDGGKRTDEFILMNKAIGVFGLPDMMKASAEALGNGTLGSAYKAAMRNGVTIAVKRMRDMNRVGRDEFEEHLQTLGELRHPNILAPVGYHYRKEEKLIVTEFMPRGSLLYVLHGDQSPNRVVLDWPARLRIAVGVARGVAYLHEKLGIPAMRFVSMDGADFDAPPPPPPHGNLKSGNILLDADLEPRVVDYGFFPLVNAAQAPQAMFAFRSPEAVAALQQQQQRVPVSARSDVYCFGVVLLELVTGRFPSQYLLNARGGTDVVHCAAAAVADGSEKDLIDPVVAAAPGARPAAVRLLRVAVECTHPAPESRPSMAQAARMVEEVAAATGVAS